MPTSQHYQLSNIMNLIVHLNPGSVLDIGPGFGKYGVLCREYLELWDGREEYREFTRRIDAIEVFEQYLTPIHKYVYNHVHIGNANEVLDRLTEKYELALLIDVLEHFTKEDGAALIRKLLSRCESVLISVPKDIGHQETMFENKHETHLAEWTAHELLALKAGFRIRDPMSHVVFLGPPEKVGRLKKIFAPGPVIALKRALTDAFRP